MDLDVVVAQAVHAAHVMERALHDPGPWQIEYAGIRVSARREVGADHVAFTARVPRVCALDEDEPLWLLCDGEPVASMVEPVLDDLAQVRWEVRCSLMQAA